MCSPSNTLHRSSRSLNFEGDEIKSFKLELFAAGDLRFGIDVVVGSVYGATKRTIDTR